MRDQRVALNLRLIGCLHSVDMTRWLEVPEAPEVSEVPDVRGARGAVNR